MSDSSRSCRPHAAFVGWLPLAALLCALLAPLAVAADAPGSKAEQLQQQVAAIDARTKSQAPLRERPLQGFAAEGARVVSWGTTGAIEKISVEGLVFGVPLEVEGKAVLHVVNFVTIEIPLSHVA